MKKYLVIAMFAIAAFGFVGCNSDDFKANINWYNDAGAGTTVYDIKWESITGNPDQTWSDSVAYTGTSSTKEVTLETGKGTCFSGGSEYEIIINGTSSSYILTDGSTETLTISSITPAKK